jgi:hypothetical protein
MENIMRTIDLSKQQQSTYAKVVIGIRERRQNEGRGRVFTIQLYDENNRAIRFLRTTSKDLALEVTSLDQGEQLLLFRFIEEAMSADPSSESVLITLGENQGLYVTRDGPFGFSIAYAR